MTAISAYGMTMLMISGEVDLSVGSLQAVVGVVVMIVLELDPQPSLRNRRWPGDWRRGRAGKRGSDPQDSASIR